MQVSVSVWWLWPLMVVLAQVGDIRSQDAATRRNSTKSSLDLLKEQRRTGSDLFSTPGSATNDSWQADVATEVPVGFCDFETPCPWQGTETGFRVVTGRSLPPPGNGSGPNADAGGNPQGHFLYVGGADRGESGLMSHHQIYSQNYSRTQLDGCDLTFAIHALNVHKDVLTIFSESSSGTIHEREVYGVSNTSWIVVRHHVGRRSKPFRLALEVIAGDRYPYHAAFDNITMENCFVDHVILSGCSDLQFECELDTCVDRSRVCDITADCPNGEDEKHQCDQFFNWNAYCTFEAGLCGWTSRSGGSSDYEWKLQNGSMSTGGLAVSLDHTYKNVSGHFVYLQTDRRTTTIGHSGLLTSAIFPPPPLDHSNAHSQYFNSCQVRFFYRMPSRSKHQLVVRVLELPGPKIVSEIWSRHAVVRDWQRVSKPIPHLRHRYQIQFMGIASYGSMIRFELDDISLSPECFIISGGNKTTSANISSRYTFNTCGANGRHGPTNEQCQEEYRFSGLEVQVSDHGPLAGIQQWTVPKTGAYSVFVKGASGGMGATNRKFSYGAVARGIFTWNQGETIFILVGQEGGSASSKIKRTGARPIRGINELKKLIEDENSSRGGGGAGGGATYIFKNESGVFVPLLVAAGGGGQSRDLKESVIDPNAKGYDPVVPAVNGKSSQDGAGGGGGWKDVTKRPSAGLSLLEGGIGGFPCKAADQRTEGGFGGGGGSCLSGGGGGGYAGGNAVTNDSLNEHGAGGYSYVASERYAHSGPGDSAGAGSVVVIPSFGGCGCDHDCVIVDLADSSYVCICDESYLLADDNVTCLIANDSLVWEEFLLKHLVVVLPVTTVIMIGVAIVMFFLYHRYRRQTVQVVRQDYVGNPELQLNRLRQATGGMVTEYNPNYEFGGSSCTIQDLREVPRENLTLVKALGQGAFGEVYQGYLANVAGELGDIPVAIKTLPELSSSQAEMDFLMEALIMSKFSHPNIVKFIGVCFEKLPKFIVLELLPGGDLKSFLRESRPKPDKASPLTMKDLLMLAIDVAKGCHYLEENHFIHRDIAARNCLLTTKDVKRVVKIADFGMARDIYRADYYRKGGKAMLPVKWMPPEAFLDGIFTSKTDVWSFGVLLWEVMSLGYMPYPGRGNQDVMQLVTSGGRLEPPNNCPQPVYHIMSQCWHPVPEERPDFVTILERLGYCLQDPDVTDAPLPVFHRPPSTERDTTVMRPTDPDNICLQVQRGDTEPQSPASTDYLIPIPSSSYSLCTEKTELQSASSMESVDHLLELDDKVGELPPNAAIGSPLKPQAAAPTSGGRLPSNWETSFMQPFLKGQAPTTWIGEYQSVPTQEEPLPLPPPPPPAPSAFQFPSIHGGGTSTPRPGAIAAIPPPESSPARKSPPSAIARQRPSVKKPASTGAGSLFPMPNEPAPESRPTAAPILPTSLPLDPSTLSKQHQAQVLPYANIAVVNPPTAAADPTRTTAALTGGARNEPYTITAPRGAAPPSNKGKYDKDVKC